MDELQGQKHTSLLVARKFKKEEKWTLPWKILIPWGHDEIFKTANLSVYFAWVETDAESVDRNRLLKPELFERIN